MAEPLTPHELTTIGQCLKAVASGPFLRDENAGDPWWEFHLLMGLHPPEVAAIAERWPNVDIASEDVSLAVNNALNNLLGYPHKRWDVWPQYISVSPDEVKRIFMKWRMLNDEGIG